jgi:hypothetical protein
MSNIPEPIRNIGTGIKNIFTEDVKEVYGERPQDYRIKKVPTKFSKSIMESIGKNIVPIVGGIGAGLFTKNTESDTPGLPSDDTALNLAEYKKAANLLDQKQGLAADMNFLPTVASRKYSPAEMAVTYAQAANGGRIGFSNGGDSDDADADNQDSSYDDGPLLIPDDSDLSPDDFYGRKEKPSGIMMVDAKGSDYYADMYMKYAQDMLNEGNEPMGIEEFVKIIKELERTGNAQGGRISKAEGGLMDLGGMEKDYRAEGGFVPIGRKEKADDVPARLSVNEFVFTADAVRNAGGGDIDQGARVMENMMKHLEAGGQVSEESQGMAGARDMFEVSERLSEVV